MNRRRFLSRTGAVAAGSLLGSALGPRALRAAGCSALPAGVQLYTVRDLLQRDPRGTLTKLHDIGIVEGELWGLNGPDGSTLFGLSAKELKQALDANGIEVPISHVGGALTNTAAISEIARTLGIGMLILALPNEFSGQRDGKFAMVPAQSRAQLDRLAARLNDVGREYRSQGLRFGYHNHYPEFIEVDGVVPYDYLMSHTDPDLVQIELDLGWLAYAGVDPVTYIERYAGRVVSCHLKDFAPKIATDVPQRKLVPPGSGTIDFAAVLKAMRAAKVAHGFIEVDVSDDSLAAVRSGYEHLRRLQGCA
jgi:sugar phosphate isomerase/epimerase